MKDTITPQQAKMMLLRLQMADIKKLQTTLIEAMSDIVDDAGIKELQKAFEAEYQRLHQATIYQQRIGGKL